ncbi:restriction of telomere capping protein 5 [Talaromyces proteolyticus]|uniref:Restriction of telomere capping protein 5 n=1 Tax=Talaromyces proteolyticus TaxID=1131652 RepID=A0AAD4PVP1_9EURO|nr:restriction of telomere capping protein 5 [Talaromyces proteolyticus]KAH8693727.1 restriction of telomere capping protein 5 [Talaromyces proteolyticus]
MGASQSAEGSGTASSPEELSTILAERFATKCFSPLELTHFKDNFYSRALDQAGFRYWNEKTLSDFLGIPDGVYTNEKGGGHDKSLDAGPVIFRMVSYLGAFPFQRSLAPSVLTFEAMVKVVVLLTERYDKVLKRGRRDRIKLLFGSLADVGRRDIEITNTQPEDASSSPKRPEKHRTHAPGFSIDEPSNDDYDENDDDDDDLALAALESLDAIEVFRHDYRADRAAYEARISVDTLHRLLMLLLTIAPLKPLQSATQYTLNLTSEKQAEVRQEADSIIAGFAPDDVKNGIGYKEFSRIVSLALPHLFDPLTPLFEHLLFSKNLDLSRRRMAQEPINTSPENPEDEVETTAPAMLPGSFDSVILNSSMISHLSFFLPALSDRNLYWGGIRFHPVFSTVAHGESLTSFSHNVLTWQASSLLLLQGSPTGASDSDEKLVTLGVYIPQPWKLSSASSASSASTNANDRSQFPCLFQLQPTHAVSLGNPIPPFHKTSVFFSHSTGVAIGCEVTPAHKTSFGPGVPSISSSHNKQQTPTPNGATSLTIDTSLETAQLHVSYLANLGGAFAPPVPPALPTITHIDIYNLEVWGIVEPEQLLSPDGANKDVISQQRAAWQFDAREAERRRGLNVKLGGGSESDYQNARAILEMAGIIGDHAHRSGGSV